MQACSRKGDYQMQLYKIALPVSFEPRLSLKINHTLHICLTSEDPTQQRFLVQSVDEQRVVTFYYVVFYRPEYHSLFRRCDKIKEGEFNRMVRLREENTPPVYKVQTQFYWMGYPIQVDEFMTPKIPFGVISLDLAKQPHSAYPWPKGIEIGEEIRHSYNRMIWKIAHGEDV